MDTRPKNVVQLFAIRIKTRKVTKVVKKKNCRQHRKATKNQKGPRTKESSPQPALKKWVEMIWWRKEHRDRYCEASTTNDTTWGDIIITIQIPGHQDEPSLTQENQLNRTKLANKVRRFLEQLELTNFKKKKKDSMRQYNHKIYGGKDTTNRY